MNQHIPGRFNKCFSFALLNQVISAESMNIPIGLVFSINRVTLRLRERKVSLVQSSFWVLKLPIRDQILKHFVRLEEKNTTSNVTVSILINNFFTESWKPSFALIFWSKKRYFEKVFI